MLKPDYPIETDRLLLRPFERGDFDDAHAYQADPEVNRFLYTEPSTSEETAARLERSLTLGELTEEGQWFVLAVCLKAENKVIGDVVLKWVSEKHRQGEIGYVFNSAFQGQGYAREAAEAMLKVGFEVFGLHRIVAECDARNEASWRLMERLGMRREAHLRQNEFFKGEWADCLVYAMLEGEYRATRQG